MTPSLGMLIGIPIGVLVFGACIVLGIVFLSWAKRNEKDWDAKGARLTGRLLVFVAPLIVIGIAALTLYPYSSDYHYWKTTSGTVANVSSRIIPSGDSSVEQRFAVTFTDGRMRACDDTRCTQVKPGGVLKLKCKRHYQWGASPGYDCNFQDYRP